MTFMKDDLVRLKKVEGAATMRVLGPYRELPSMVRCVREDGSSTDLDGHPYRVEDLELVERLPEGVSRLPVRGD